MPATRNVPHRSPIRKTRACASVTVDDGGWPTYDPKAFEDNRTRATSSSTPSCSPPPPRSRRRSSNFYESSLLPDSGRTIYDKFGNVKTKRPRNSFIFFRSDMYKRYHHSGKKMDQNALSKFAGEQWKLLTPTEREPFQKQAREEKVWYDENLPDYVYKTAGAKAKEKRMGAPAFKVNGRRVRRRSSATTVDIQVKQEVEAVEVPKVESLDAETSRPTSPNAPIVSPESTPTTSATELRAPKPVTPIHIDKLSDFMAQWPGSEPEQPLADESKEAFAHEYEHSLSHPRPSSLEYMNCGLGTGFESEAMVYDPLQDYYIEASESVTSYPSWLDSPAIEEEIVSETRRSESPYGSYVWDDAES